MKPVLEQVWIQTESVIATLIYASIVTYVLLKLVDVMIGIRVSAEEERMGLDLSLHGESLEPAWKSSWFWQNFLLTPLFQAF